MPKLQEFLDLVLLEATPEERLRFARIMFRAIVTVHIAWACGFLQPFGLSGFVFASDVDDKIAESVEPLQAQIGAIATQIAVEAERSKARDDEIDEALKLIRIGQIAGQLRDLQRTRCGSDDKEIKARMEREIEDAQQEYRRLTGERYPIPSCDSL